MKETRKLILQTAFEAIHKYGYSGTRIDKELKKIGITKGAFYHYFESKNDLLLAVIKELLGPAFVKPWSTLNNSTLPVLDQIQIILQKHIDGSSNAEIKYGCILNNLVHETAAQIPEVRELLENSLEKARNYMKIALEAEILRNKIDKTLSAEELSYLILSVYNGANSLNKLQQKRTPYKKAIKALIILLEKYKK